jgi:uncharacterized ParB-like nuclease family protein
MARAEQGLHFPLAGELYGFGGCHMNPTLEPEWRKRLRAHDRKVLAATVTVLGAYFAALIAVIQWALASSGH